MYAGKKETLPDSGRKEYEGQGYSHYREGGSSGDISKLEN